MQGLRDLLQQTQQRGVAIGHFNISDLVLLKAVVAAARELDVPVIVGASQGERDFMGVHEIAALVKSLREESGVSIFLNADHTHSLAKAEEAAKAGFDAVVFDLSALPIEENVRQTKEAVVALKAIHPPILIEGEIGDIGTGSEIHETTIDVSKGSIKFSCQGDIGNGQVTLKPYDDPEKPENNVSIELSQGVSLSFSLKYLINFTKASPLSGSVTLRLLEAMPILVEYNMEGVGHLQ